MRKLRCNLLHGTRLSAELHAAVLQFASWVLAPLLLTS